MLLSTAKRELGVPDIISADSLSSSSLAEEALCTYLSLFLVAMSGSLINWLRAMLGSSGPRALSPEEWRNGELLGRLVQARVPDTAGPRRDLSDLFGLLRDRLGTCSHSVQQGVTSLSLCRYPDSCQSPGAEGGASGPAVAADVAAPDTTRPH